MPAGLPDPGKIWNDFITNPLVQTAGTLIVIYVVLLWLGTAYWAFRDMQQRSDNAILPYLAATGIILFTPIFFVLAVWVYKIVRPHEKIGEVWERNLAEEALLAVDGAVFNARVHADTGAQPGRSISLAVDPRGFHFFDLATGENITPANAPEPVAA
jgi:hypothetical protein